METISDYLHLKVKLMEKFIFMLTLPKGRLKSFSFYHRCRGDRWCTLSCEYFRKFFKNFKTTLMVSGTWGKLIHEKNLKSKISWHYPLKWLEIFDLQNSRRVTEN
jgi:hypothetical protein